MATLTFHLEKLEEESPQPLLRQAQDRLLQGGAKSPQPLFKKRGI
jgi:hypothetical protein